MERRLDKSSSNANMGCIWRLIGTFDFRRGSSKMLTQRRKRAAKHLGNLYAGSKATLQAGSERQQEDLSVSDQREAMKHKSSIKKLMEKEMSTMKQAKKIYHAENEQINIRLRTSDLVHSSHANELEDISDKKLLKCVSNNISALLEELIDIKKQKMHTFSDGYHEHANAGTYNIDQVDTRPFQVQEHFMLQVLDSLINNNIPLAKQIVSRSGSNQYEELRNTLEILSSNEGLLLKVLQGTKSNFGKHIKDDLGRSKSKSHREKSHEDPRETVKSEHDIDRSQELVNFDTHDPFSKDQPFISEKQPAVNVPQSSNRIAIHKSHPSRVRNSSDVSDLPGSTVSTLYEIRKGSQEQKGMPIFFQDIRMRLRQFTRDAENDQSIDGDGESYALEHSLQPSSGSKREETVLTQKEPHVTDGLDIVAKSSDTDIICISGEAVSLKKSKENFVDLKENGDHDQNLMCTVSESMKDSLSCATQDTDIDFPRSSVLNRENSTRIHDISEAENDTNKHDHLVCSSKKTHTCMPIEPFTNFKALDLAENKLEKSSPTSVLEPVFSERFVSPLSMPTKRAKSHLFYPRKILFKDYNFAKPTHVMTINPGAQMSSCVNDDEFKYGYLRSLLEASGLCDCDISEKVQSPYQLLDPTLYDEVETPSEEIPDDLRLFFDSVNEVLVEIYEKSSSPMPWVLSICKPGVRHFPSGENLINEAWCGLNRFFVAQSTITLNKIVEGEFEKRPWVDFRYGAEVTCFDFSDAIMETLLQETIDGLCESTSLQANL